MDLLVGISGRPGRACRGGVWGVLGMIWALVSSSTPTVEAAGARPGVLASTPSPVLDLGIPSDCFFSMFGTAGAGRNVFDAHVADMLEALRTDGVLDATLRNLLGSEFEDQAVLERELVTWRRIFANVDWRRLFASEFAVGMRYEYPTIELLALFRINPARRNVVADQLKRVLYGVAALGESDFEIHSDTLDGVETLVVQSTTDPYAQICLGGRKDLIGLSTSSRILRRSLRLLEGGSSDWGLALAPDYSATFADLSGPEDSFRLYLRPSVYFDQLRRLSDVLQGMSEMPDEQQRIRDQLGTVLDTLDIVDVVAASGKARGVRLDADFRIRLTDRARDSSVYSAFGEQPPIQNLARDVGEQATSFLAWNGIDFGAVLRALVRLESAGFLPWNDGDETLSKARDSHAGLDAFLDLLENVDGRVLALTRKPRPGIPPAPILRAELRDPDAAREALARLIGWLKADGGLAVSDSVVAKGKDTAFVVSAAGIELFTVGIQGNELSLGRSLADLESSGDDEGNQSDDVPLLSRLQESGVKLHPSQQLACFVDVDSVRPWMEIVSLLYTRASPDETNLAGGAGRILFELWRKAFDVFETESIGIHRVGDSYHGQWNLELRAREN